MGVVYATILLLIMCWGCESRDVWIHDRSKNKYAHSVNIVI